MFFGFNDHYLQPQQQPLFDDDETWAPYPYPQLVAADLRAQLYRQLWQELTLDLSFDLAVVEQEYQKQQFRNVIRRDRLMSKAIIIFSLVHFLWNLFVVKQGLKLEVFMLDLCAVSGSLVVMGLISQWAEFYCQRRTLLLTLIRFCVILFLCPVLVRPWLADGSAQALLQYSILGSGTMICLLYSLAYRLSLPIEVLIELLCCLILMLHSQHICNSQEKDECNLIPSEQYGFFTQCMFFGMGIPQVQDKGLQCLFLMGLIGVWGFLIPSSVVCLMEKWTRDKFLQRHPRRAEISTKRLQLHWLVFYFVSQLMIARTINSWIFRLDC
eukprot:TRINITY_DN9686_c0_g1_i2.p1 TRINITY_DN9686_c0_g1~~TRINITY_DN9686_c0_g1_i2.p1  ORF type:complete len:346 (+),score=6.60 TRINITY_DN9686_c0_g1_i2:62-1039(+)